MAEPEERLHRLLDVGQELVAELDHATVLDRILEAAREVTGARYAALGVLQEDRKALEQFLTAGVDPATRREIAQLPRGRGVLGVLIEDPRPLRLREVGQHPESYGFPAGHPEMHTFLGVPILIRGRAWGNLYMAEKSGAEEFSQEDEAAAVTLAQWAGIAVENARIHEASERRRQQLEHAVSSLEAARDIANAVGNVDDLDRVLELIVKRGRALIGARNLLMLLMVRNGDELVVVASAGRVTGARGRRLPIDGSTSGEVLRLGKSRRVPNVARDLRIPATGLGIAAAQTALIVPMLHRGEAIGVLAAFDHDRNSGEFSAEDERLLETFAQAAANAVALKNSVTRDRLRAAISAADAERHRWARELHDETLQALGGLRVLLASTVGRGDAETKDQAIRQAVEDVQVEITNLRRLITDLRPSLLDDLGLIPALDALLERRNAEGLRIEAHLNLDTPGGDPVRLAPELETTLYRVVQEALTNIVKHARASTARVSIRREDGDVAVEVQDDGTGFDPNAGSQGFGLEGMRERVSLAGGTLSVDSGENGTLVQARLPLRQHDYGLSAVPPDPEEMTA